MSALTQTTLASSTMPQGKLLMQMRHLVDLVTQHVTESGMVLGTDTIDSLITQATAHAETVGSHAHSAAVDAPNGTFHAVEPLDHEQAAVPTGFTNWREAAVSEREIRTLAERQRGFARAELHAVCELVKTARERISLVVTAPANLQSEGWRQEAIAKLDAALGIRRLIPVPGDAVRYGRLRLIGCTPVGATSALLEQEIDRFVDMDLLTEPDRADDAFAAFETPAERALRAIASYLGVGGYNSPVVDAEKFQAKIVEEIAAISARSASAAAQVVSPPSEFTTTDNDLNQLLDLVAMMLEGGGNHDVGMGFLMALDKVLARLVPVDAAPAMRLIVTPGAEDGSQACVATELLTQLPLGEHTLFALPVSASPA